MNSIDRLLAHVDEEEQKRSSAGETAERRGSTGTSDPIKDLLDHVAAVESGELPRYTSTDYSETSYQEPQSEQASFGERIKNFFKGSDNRRDENGLSGSQTQRFRDLQAQLNEIDRNSGYATTAETSDELEQQRRNIIRQLDELDEEAGREARTYSPSDRIDNVIKSWLNRTGAGYTNAAGSILDLGSSKRKSLRQQQEGADMARFAERNPEAAAEAQAAEERYRQSLRGARDSTYKAADKMQSSAERQLAKSEYGASAAGSFAIDAAMTGADIIADAAFAKLTGITGLANMALRVYGSESQDARLSGDDAETAAAKGLKAATIEVITEKLAGPFELAYGKSLGRQAMGKTAGKIARVFDRLETNGVLKWVFDTAGEGAEEGLSDVLNIIADHVFGWDDGDMTILEEIASDKDDILYDMILGAFVGAFGATTSAIAEGEQGRRVKNIYGKEGAAALVDEGLLSGEGTKSRRLAERYNEKLQSGRELTGREMSQLIEANDMAFADESPENRGAEASEPEQTDHIEKVISKIAKNDTAADLLREDFTLGEADAETYARGAEEAYNYGKLGVSMEDAMQNGSFINDLTAAQRDHAYKLGQQESSADTLTEEDAALGAGADAADANAENVDAYAAKYGDEAPAVIASYNSGEVKGVGEFSTAFDAAYNMGRSGVPESELSASAALSYLSDAQRKTAFDMGRASASKAAAQAQTEVKSAAKPGKLNRKGVVKGEGVTLKELKSTFNDRQNTAYRLLSTFAEATGVDVVLYKTSAEPDGSFASEQGRFTWKDDTIYVDINSGLYSSKDVESLGKYTMMRTFAHEFTHFIEKWNPAQYNDFRSFVFGTLAGKGESVNDLIESKMSLDSSGKLDYEQASREVIADAMVDILPDSNIVQRLASEHESIYKKLLQKLRDFTARLKQYYKEITTRPGREAQALKEQVGEGTRYMQSIVDMWTDAAQGAVQNYKAAEGSAEPTAKPAQKKAAVQAKPQKTATPARQDAKKPKTRFPNLPMKNGTPSEKTAYRILTEYLSAGKKLTSKELYAICDEAFDGTQAEGAYDRKAAYDAMELAVNKYLLENAADLNGSTAEDARRGLERVQGILSLLPTQNVRTQEMEQFQQFSTPPNIAYLAAWAADINNSDVVLEPSAGIGGLAAFAKAWGAEVAVNELSERRLAVLKAMGFDHVFNENAEQIDNVLPESIKPTAVIMNPPFSSTAGRTATNKTSNAERHINQALARLSDGGRLVAILGRGMADKAYSKYWDKLRQDYNIRANLSIDGENYKKYGTTFDVQLVVIDKTGAQGSAETVTGSYKDLAEIPNVLEGIRNDRSAEIERDSAVAGVQETSVAPSGTGGQQSVSPAVDTADGGDDAGVLELGSRPGSTGEPRSADIHGEVQRGIRGASAADGAAVQQQRADAADKKSGKRTDRGADRGADRGGERNAAGDAGRQLNIQRLGAGGLETESARGQVSERGRSNKRSDDGVYADYVAPELTVKGSKPHPAVLVESSAMSAVPMPKATYTPHLPENVIKNNLSTEQLVSVTYAGQAHEQTLPNGERKGFFIGDGTGVGKGREISGIILDNFEQGRDKAVWISKNDKLFTDAQRDWVDTTGRSKDEVHFQGKTKLQNKIDFGSGILFTTYPTLRTEKGQLSRVNQIVEWLGKDFDGVIAFDEAHNMGNLFGKSGKFGKTKGSAMAAAAVKLQSLLPKARVVYVSATAATDVQGLAFASRLGLWGRGTAFTDVNDFVSKIQSSGIAAMELVVRDMKAMGVYVSRSISYNGVSYDTVQHDLDPMQTEIYNTMSRAWQRTMGSVEESLKSTGGVHNSNAKRLAIGQYYSAIQRFYNQVLTSMSMPSVIADMKKELAAGRSCVLQIVNTNQAEADRQIASIKADGGSLDDLDLTPRGTLIGYLENCYPVIQYEEYTDENGVVRSRPVTNSKGESVIDRAAVKKRDALIKEVEQMSIPDGPLEILFNAFGTDQVAEITGRTRRVVPRKQPDGSIKRVEESRSETHTAADVQAFLDGDKRILVFSDAGGTGKSYHASRTVKNQQQRVHYVLQPGWVASTAVQGFGRTHRSNQSSAPIYKLVTTNIKGQKRFTSTIARRLDQLGALTKGQRDTGSGMFGAKDNLETDLARDSLREFYRRLGKNQIDGIDGMDTLQRLGLKSKFTDEFGAFKLDDSTSRDISTFLNRILALEVDEQNTLFDAFINIYDTEMEAAIQAGTLDTGMENVKADKIEIVDDKVIKEQETTGAATHYIQAKTYTKPKIISTVAAAENLRSGFMGIYKTKNGDIRAVYRIADKTTEWGEVQKQYKLQSPNAAKSSIWKESSFEKNAELLPKGEWQTEWDKEIKKVPEYNEDTKHMLTGTLLPIWYALPEDGNTKVQRLVADDGSTYLGRVISPDKIDSVLKRFNLNRTKENFTAEKVIDSAIKRGTRFDLTYYRAQLLRSRVSGEWRLEYRQPQNAWYVARQFPELIHEKINYQDRYFVPLNDEGRAVLDKILEENPVTNTSEDNDSDGYVQYSKRGRDDSSADSYDPETANVKEQIANSSAELNKMTVAATVNAPANFTSKEAASKWAIAMLEHTGFQVDRKNFGKIFFSQKDIKTSVRYADTAAEKAAFAALPAVLKKGIEIGRHSNHKARGKETVTFAAPVILNGVRGNMGVVVNLRGNHYYAHRIVLPDGGIFVLSENENDAARELPRGVTVSGSLADATSTASVNSIASGLNFDKENFATEVDTELSTRAPSLSDREVLQYAAENIDASTLTPAQADALRIFKERVDRLQELQEQRQELGREYREQQFKRPVDRNAAAVTKNRMGVLDGKIRALENSVVSLEDKDVLRQVLKEARRFVEKRERTQGALRLKEYREARNESASLKKYRARVLKEAETLREMLMKPSNKNVLKRVPGAIQKTVADFIGAIDFTSKQALRGGAATQADQRIMSQMRAMRDAIKDNIDLQGEYSGYADLPPDFMDSFRKQIDRMQELVNQSSGEYVINKMSAAELRELAHTLRDIRRYIQDMNRFHENAMFQHAYDAGEDTIADLETKGKARRLRNNGAYNFLAWQYMRPVDGLERLGRGGKSISDEFRKGQAKQAFLAKQVIDFSEKAYTAKEAQTWSREVKAVQIGDSTVHMTAAQAMSFYCLMRRPQARTHIFGDGIRVANFENGKMVYRDEGHRLTVEEANAIINSLSERQKAVADKLQKFMSEECAEWGNYVSLARFGTKLFGEENYFPINSDGRYLQATAEESPSNASLYALLNMGFTKELNEKARNRIVLYDIFDVFANHAASMTQYSSFALPVLDALKWFNYKNDETSVRDKMATAYGAPTEGKPGSGSKSYAESFVLNLLKQFNGTAARGDSYDSRGIKALHLFNRAQVAYNVRVIVQQPAAITRAAQIISPTKLAKGLSMSAMQMKTLAAEMEAHSGIAAWKGLGFYDTNISRGLTALIKHDQSFAGKVTEVGMTGAEQADRFTWAAMWYACKDSVKRSDYKTEGEYFDAVTELFEDVIYKTQVVDSVLTKAEFLRAQGFFPRMMGSFMSEPSATVSMLMDTYMQYTDALQSGMSKGAAWQKYGDTIRRTITVYAIGQVLISAVQAVADAWRDDDDYQTFWEKYLEALKGNLVDNLLPFGNIPYVSELYDLAKNLLSKFGVDTYGNSISNGWMQYAQYLERATEIFADKIRGNNTRYTTWGGVYNLLRAVAGMTGLPLATATREVIDVWNNTIGAANPDRKIKTYDSGAKASIKYAYQDGYLSFDEAVEKLREEGVETDKNKAYLMVKSWDTGGKYSELTAAAASGDRAAFRAALQELVEHGVAEKDAYNAVRKDIKERYLDGDITEAQAISALTAFGDKDRDEAQGYVQGWQFSRDYPQYDWTDAEITTYSTDIKRTGISPDVFDRYLTGLDNCKGTDDDGDGKTDSGSVRAQAIIMIDALPISVAQKDALYLLNWKESTLSKTPWHS